MAKSNSDYRKLSGRSSMSVQKVYLGDDHVLVVDGQYKETYKRLAYSDIEAILVCPTKSASVIALILLLMGIPMMLSLPISGVDLVPMFIFGLIFSLIGGALLYGKGSVVFGIKTSVQTVVINGVNSRRKAAKAEAKLVTEIERVQGILTDEALQQAIHEDPGRYGRRVGGWTRQAESPTATPPPIKSSQSESPAEV
ncbi:MAG: hypothetical protein ACSHYA_06920 [Opitutaceae bacterium]